MSLVNIDSGGSLCLALLAFLLMAGSAAVAAGGVALYFYIK